MMLRLSNVAAEGRDAMRGFRGFNLGAALTLALKSVAKQSDFAA
jgi:hypothetical protein